MIRALGDGVGFAGPADAHVAASASELIEVLEYYECEVVVAPTSALVAVGYLDALESYLDHGAAVAVVDEGNLFALAADPVGDVVRIDGRCVHADTGEPALVLLPAGPGASRVVPPLVAGYAHAVDDSVDPHYVASEVLELSYWTPQYCQDLIDHVEALDAWDRDDSDPVPGDEVSLAVVSPRLFARVEADIGQRVVPRLRRFWPEFAWCGLHDTFVIRFAGGGARRSLALHHDVAQISGTVRLNGDYVGGALEFPRQGYDTGATPVGHLTMWPSLVTHPHRSAPVTAGVKYGLTIWFALPPP